MAARASIGVCALCDVLHDFSVGDRAQCVPPSTVVRFAGACLPVPYRALLFDENPGMTVAELVAAYFGANPLHLSGAEWADTILEVSDDLSSSDGECSTVHDDDSASDSGASTC